MSSVFDHQAATYDRWYATLLGQLVDRVEKEPFSACCQDFPAAGSWKWVAAPATFPWPWPC
ncbi:MAG: hypothetical protein K6T55_11465 [Syntrophobacterales bacterium]|nr:hypothetical protein [Syntrophobacterales bacterium]